MGDAAAIDRFINRWRANEGGAERANYVLFLTELCTLLDLSQPDPADASHTRNDYVFERAVTFKDEAGKAGHGRIDLYKRGAFVLEAKQSREPGGKKEVALPAEQTTLPGFAPTQIRGRRSAQRGWDVLMRNAREQAEQYARALPTDHGWPPFIIVADVGHAFEIFADFSGQGKNYRQFPDRSGYRIYLDDLREEGVRARLRAMWLDPHSLDPAKHAAAVTRDIAKRLASVSKLLEERGYQPEPVAHFLMRCLFTMFAEDTKLLPEGSFTEMLGEARDNPASFAPMLEGLWRDMDKGTPFSELLRKKVRKFNGGLFAERTAIPLHKEEIGELYEAARHVWTEVEPAIFGTLLEQALDKVERRRLGAHYTPRAYVERLVIATIIEPLQREWETEVLGTVERERTADPQGAIRAVHDFHEKLAATRVLDPACGTGNFLYVALELMKRLEGDVLEVLADLGGQEALALETATVHPRNFLGLELNPRAAAIAELVLWLGYLQWQMRNGGQIADPVLERLSNITAMDAVLKHDAGRTRDDGSFEEFPNPRRPDWPQADYIVGNPPFIGGGNLRGRLGDGYATALWKAHPKINKSADFVMYWWDRAAGRLTEKGTRLKRFGFVTTNSITQEFSRRVMAARMDARAPIGLVMAVGDHPWTKATKDAAAVRIAMTVAEAGTREGILYEVISEEGLDTDAPVIKLSSAQVYINPDLSAGADVTKTAALRSNEWISARGIEFHGDGYVLGRASFELMAASGPVKYFKKYISSGDIKSGSIRDQIVIDLYDLTADQVRRKFPATYQHLMQTAKPSRASNKVDRRRDEWWKLALPHDDLRDGLVGINKFVGTVVTSKHRTFSFIDASYFPDQSILAILVEDSWILGTLGSKIHEVWSLVTCGWMGVGNDPRYLKRKTFDPFPFPDATLDQRKIIGDLAEDLDATRKEVLAEHADLTLTGLYNLRAQMAQHGPFSAVEQDQRRRGRVDIIAELHDRIDAAVADAYGWPRDLTDEAIVTRLVALNAERHAEEKAGKVRWLRPDYQLPRAGVTVLAPKAQPEQIEALLPAATTRKPAFPRDAIGQTAAVLADLRGGAGLTSAEIARRYSQGLKAEPRIAATLAALVRLGHVSAEAAAPDAARYTLRRAA